MTITESSIYPPVDPPAVGSLPGSSSASVYKSVYYAEFKYLDEAGDVQVRYFPLTSDDIEGEFRALRALDEVSLSHFLENDEPPYEFGTFSQGIIPKSRFVSWTQYRTLRKYTQAVTNTLVSTVTSTQTD